MFVIVTMVPGDGYPSWTYGPFDSDKEAGSFLEGKGYKKVGPSYYTSGDYAYVVKVEDSSGKWHMG